MSKNFLRLFKKVKTEGDLSVTLYLPIKTYYLQKIKCGEKRIEYREASPYWEKCFKKQYSEVVFHQYRGPLLRMRVEAIRKVPTPPHLTMIKTETCFAIKLGEILETTKTRVR